MLGGTSLCISDYSSALIMAENKNHFMRDCCSILGCLL